MKILKGQEEERHYKATIFGGIKGGLLGLAAGFAAVLAGHRRFQTIRGLTLPMKAFLITSSGTFFSIISADRASRDFEANRDPSRKYRDKASQEVEQLEALKPIFQRFKGWAGENRYPIVTASWIASMGAAFAIVSRNKYLTGAQKLVQARLYAQGLTLAVLIATAAFEVGDAKTGKGRWETVKVIDPNDPDHKSLIEKRIHHEAYAGEDLWKDMVAAEERKIEARKAAEEETLEHKIPDLSPDLSKGKETKT